MIKDNIDNINRELPSAVKLVAVSKFHPASAIIEAYEAGQRVFAESRPQEFEKKINELQPWLAEHDSDPVEWHFIGHLQTNKLKMVLPYVNLVQSVDTRHLLEEINKWGQNHSRIIDVLLEMHIGAEDTKQGFHEEEILELLFSADKYKFVRFCGLMGMASHTDDEKTISADFERIDSFMAYLVDLFPEQDSFRQLSIGMSDDWKIAVSHGSTMIRIGTSIFGEREY